MKLSPILILAIAFVTSRDLAAGEPSLASLPNPLQGTDSYSGYSHGNTYPAVAVPFPMNIWSPYTQPAKDPFYYQYRQSQIRGFRQTHQPSPWIGDYSVFSLMPVSGRLAVSEDERASTFSHENETSQAAYYRVRLDTWKATAEITPTERCARFRFTFDQPGDAFIVLDAFAGGSKVEIIPAENKIIGICFGNRGGVPTNFANYFVIVFDRPFTAHGVWSPEGVCSDTNRLAGQHVGAFVKFQAGTKARSKVVECKVASSFISPEQALRTLEREIGSANFATIRQRAEAAWDQMLGRAKIEGGSLEQQKTFYSALYRTILFPHKFYEMNSEGRPVYFSPYDGKLHEGVLYTDTGFWDTFRAAHPLYNLLYPEISRDILQGLLNAYDQSGWLPEWSSPGHRECMIGNHAFSLLADGWAKGIRNFDLNKAVDAVVHDANHQAPDTCKSIGRDGAEYYNRIGYVPYSATPGEPSFREAAAKTLEYAYDDYCAALLSRAAGRNTEAAEFESKSMNYTNLFDVKTGFMRGRKASGAWCEPFDPIEWGGPFTEGCSWHWTWSVFQDVTGLARLLGGDAAMAAKLDAVFTSPNNFKIGTYDCEIHEMTEMVALNMGQYAHGNEPIHHMIYLYDYVGQPWKTQSRARLLTSMLYQSTPDGLCGDDDTGQTSAWYVFSALGFYPLCPGDTAYAIGSPIFDKATLRVGDGKSFTITARNNGPQRAYIKGATLNGAAWEKVYLTHEQMLHGGEVIFDMTSAPDYKWGTAPEARPNKK